jgi:hypothetical protein
MAINPSQINLEPKVVRSRIIVMYILSTIVLGAFAQVAFQFSHRSNVPEIINI